MDPHQLLWLMKQLFALAYVLVGPHQLLWLMKQLFALAFVLIGACFFAVSSRRAAAIARAAGAEGVAGKRLRFWSTIQLRLLATSTMLLGVIWEAPTINLVLVGGGLAFMIMLAGFVIPAIAVMSRRASPEEGAPRTEQ